MVGTQRMTEDYARSVARVAYLWGWPLVNMHNRLSIMSQVPEPGLLGGVVPAAPPGSVGMLHDYIRPEERLVACPNQDVVYGFGAIDGRQGPSVVQVPDFGDRFWVYQVVDQRTDSFVELGAMYGTAPGCYLIAPIDWQGEIPTGIAGVFRFDTRIAVCIPRVFMDDTDDDRARIQDVINKIMAYPLAEFTGEPQVTDWSRVPSFPAGDTTGSETETQWVDPTVFFDVLPEVLREVPPRPGEESLYQLVQGLLDAAAADAALAEVIRDEAVRTQQTLLSELFEFRNIGVPITDHWSTQRNGAAFGNDYLSRTAMGRANIFVNTPSETSYFYQDLDDNGDRLDGSSSTYSVTFGAGGLPPVRGFWSLTLYNQHHFFYPNELDRYSLGTKNKNLRYNDDGSLTIIASNRRPTDEAMRSNWLPAPDSPFSLYLRAYWPEADIASGTWAPPAVKRS